MLHYALVFFIIAAIAAIFGFLGMGNTAMIAVAIVFTLLAVIALLVRPNKDDDKDGGDWQ